MATQQANVMSPSIGSLNLSESTYSLASISTAPASETFEVFDESSSEDEVVWAGAELEDDEDFILVPHNGPSPASPNLEAASGLIGAMARLTPQSPDPVSRLTIIMPPVTATTPVPVTPTQPQGGSKDSSSVKPASNRGALVLASSASHAPSSKRKNRGRRHKPEKDADVAASYPSPVTSSDGELAVFEEDEDRPGFGVLPVVESDDESDYEKARSFITSVISNPSATLYSACARLTLLQSLIIEFGLIPSASDVLPSSLRSARRFLKSHVFVNIGDYLWAREQGPDEIQNVIFPNRKALLNDLRKKGHRKRLTNVGWVKEHGLDVLLVSPWGRRH